MKLPEFEDTNGRIWQPISMHFVLAFCGKCAEIECQSQGIQGTKTFVYRVDTQKLYQWDSSELIDSQPLAGSFTQALSELFSL